MVEKCDCCDAAEKEMKNGRLVELEGGWRLNHFGGKEKYLGWLVLQTKCHRRKWEELEDTELKHLGKNIQLININLRKYWNEKYPEDKLEQIYASYLNESPYKKGLKGDELFKQLHVHIHLLVRTRKIYNSLECPKCTLGWHLVDKTHEFPEYLQISGTDDKKVRDLMKYLKGLLATKIE